MADVKFTCTHCGQEIECDELWCERQIECPTCKKELTVPPKPDAPPHASLAAAKPGQAKLSIGHSRNQRSAAPPPPPPAPRPPQGSGRRRRRRPPHPRPPLRRGSCPSCPPFGPSISPPAPLP